MFKISHSAMIFLSGLTWLLVGCFLLPLGLNFIVESLLKENISQSYPVLNFLAQYVDGLEPAALIWIAFALFVGFLKGKKIFAKSVNRNVTRILALPNPSSLSKIYTPQYYILLGIMVLIGVLVKFLPMDIRGGIDVAVGSALINGAILYFRHAWQVRVRVNLKS